MRQDISIISSGVSVGMIALADYVSSPSSVGSYMSYDIPELLISTGGRTQTQVVNGGEYTPNQYSSRLLWLKKPYRY